MVSKKNLVVLESNGSTGRAEAEKYTYTSTHELEEKQKFISFALKCLNEGA